MATENVSAAPRVRLRVPLITFAVWAAINAVGQSVEWKNDAVDWLVLLSSSVLAGYFLLAWVAIYVPAPRRVRMAPLIGALFGTAVFFAIFKIEYLGAMRFELRYRWGPSDADLALDGDIKAAGAAVAPQAGPTDFPQFLGPDRNGIISGRALDRDWEANPPRLLWQQRIGAGYSGFAAVGPWAVTQEQRGDDEMVTCYEVATGELRWTHSNSVRFTSTLGGIGPRATPSIAAGKVYAVGATGILDCLDFVTGNLLWSRDVVAENGGEVENWGKSASPLVVDEKLIVSVGAPNGKSLIAYQKDTGEQIWSAGDRRASYASPTLMTLAGVPQVVVVNDGEIAGHDLATGRILWQRPWEGSSSSNASNTQPHHVGGDRIFISKGYGIGSQLFQVRRNGDQWTTADIWPAGGGGKPVMKSKFSNVAIYEGHVYGLDDGIFQCIELATGKPRWKKGRLGYGQQLLVGNLLLVMAESSGELHLIEPTPEEYRPLGKIDALEPTKTWNNLCLVGPYLLLRNDQQAACYRLPGL